MGVPMIIYISLFTFFISIYSLGQDTQMLKEASERNQRIIETIKKENLNCCDYRSEVRCNEIMQPSSSKNGINVFQMTWTEDNKQAYLIPLNYFPNSDGGKVSFMGAETMGSYYEPITRDVSVEGNKTIWTGKDSKKWDVKFERRDLNSTTRMRPFNSKGGPSVCYVQAQIPEIQALIKEETSNDIWCYPKEGGSPTQIITLEGKVKICSMDITCRSPGIFGASADSPSVCKMVKVNGVEECPPPTHCAGDPSVTIEQGKTVLTDKTKYPDFKMKKQDDANQATK